MFFQKNLHPHLPSTFGLTTRQILNQCFESTPDADALKRTFDVLLTRHDDIARLCACLICFDLASMGQEEYQHIFESNYSTDLIKHWAQQEPLVAECTSLSPHLRHLWHAILEASKHFDPRLGLSPSEMLQDENNASPTLEPSMYLRARQSIANLIVPESNDTFQEDADLNKSFSDALLIFYGFDNNHPLGNPRAGFYLNTREDLHRVTTFLKHLEPLTEKLPRARAYRILVLLFYGTHLRSKNFFGVISQDKQAILREGLRAFVAHGPDFWKVVQTLNVIRNFSGVWPKIVDLLVDFIKWRAHACKDASKNVDVDQYDAVGRILVRQKKLGERRTSNRDPASPSSNFQ